MRLIYIAPLPLPQRNPIDSTSDSKKLWIFSKARHIGSGLSNKFLRSWICGKSKSFVGSKLGQNLHRWHCGFSNNKDLWWMCSRVTLSLIWVLQSCLLSLPCSSESSSLWAYKQNHLDVMPMKCKMNICLKWQFFVIVIVTCPGTELFHHGSWNVFWQEVMEDTGAPCLQNFDFLTSLFIQIWICASSPLSKQILDFCTTSTIPCYGKRNKTNSGRLGGKRGCLMGRIASTATSDGSPDNL